MIKIHVIQVIAFFVTGFLVPPVFANVTPKTVDVSPKQETAVSKPTISHDEATRLYFSDSELITQDNKKVKFYTDLLKDKVVLIQFIFTQCTDACPLTTKQLADTQKILGDRLGNDIYFLSISVDPEQDTPKLLKEYSQRFNAKKGWFFLTGLKQNVDKVNRKLGQAAPVKEGHLPLFLIGNVKTGHWLKMQPYSAPSMIAEQLLSLADEK